MKSYILLLASTLLGPLVQCHPQGFTLSLTIGSPTSFSIPTNLPTTKKTGTSPSTATSTSKTTSSSTNPKTTSTPPSSSKSSAPPPTTTTSPPAQVTNPWNAQCPIPSSYTINDFKSTDGASGSVSLTITYGSGTFTCPDGEDFYQGTYSINCDDDGLVQVNTDGATWLWVQEWFWCTAVPQAHDSYSTLQSTANITNLASVLSCTVNPSGIRECLQTTPDFTIPVQSYGTGGIIGFEPLNTDGSYLPACPTTVDANPIVTDTESCTLTSTASAGKGGTSSFVSTFPTVTIGGWVGPGPL